MTTVKGIKQQTNQPTTSTNDSLNLACKATNVGLDITEYHCLLAHLKRVKIFTDNFKWVSSMDFAGKDFDIVAYVCSCFSLEGNYVWGKI